MRTAGVLNGRPDWSADELLKPWRRGRLEFPFTSLERTPGQQRARILAFVFGTGALIAVIMFALLAGFGLVPEICRDPKVTTTWPDPWFPYKLSLGAGGIGAALLALILFPFAGGGQTALGHPWTLTATEDGLTLAETEGQTFAGAWADWSLEGYDVMSIGRGGQVITGFTLRLGERTFTIGLLRMWNQRKLMKAVARMIAV